jgi:predicted P-loop ATPase
MIIVTEYEETREIIEQNYADRLSFNEATQDIYLDGSLYELSRFREIVYTELGKVLAHDKYIDELVYIYATKHPFHIIRDYLDSCKMQYPNVDYHEVFKQLNEEVLHIDPDSLEALYLPKTLTAMVKRIYEPGCQHDTVLVIQGGQGFYKTSFFRELAGQDNFTSVTFHNFNTDEKMVCHSKWIIELGEVEGTLQPSKLANLKAFITTQIDSFRKPYARQPVDISRRFVLVGTTNQEKFLRDATGNRRFWVIPINQKIDIEWVKQNRDEIWAAAIQAYLDGYCTYLNETEQQLSDSINAQKYFEEDVWTEPVTSWVMGQTEQFTLSDVMEQALDKSPGTWKPYERKRVKAILNSLGLETPEKTTRYKGKGGKWYQPLNTKAVA